MQIWNQASPNEFAALNGLSVYSENGGQDKISSPFEMSEMATSPTLSPAASAQLELHFHFTDKMAPLPVSIQGCSVEHSL